MPTDSVQTRQDGPFLRIAIDRPEADNAIDTALVRRLHDALELAECTSSCRAVVLEGRPGSFCTGLDFGATAQANRSGPPAAGAGREYFSLLRRLTTIPRVVVAAVDGRAVAGGLGLVAASDLVLSTNAGRFSLPEALWGLLPCCVLPFLIRRVGFQSAYSLTLSTSSMGVDDAVRHRLVDERVDDLEPALRRLAMRLRRVEPATVGDLKRYFHRLWEITPEVENVALEELDRLMASPRVQQNIEAFARDRRFPWES
ncbi:MAG: enoyl-CoA hydratase-related protein [Myxococcota bacterium]